MSDQDSFEENENIVMNLHNPPNRSASRQHGNNFFQIKLDILDKRKFLYNLSQ
jgi:hypothetical protein